MYYDFTNALKSKIQLNECFNEEEMGVTFLKRRNIVVTVRLHESRDLLESHIDNNNILIIKTLV